MLSWKIDGFGWTIQENRKPCCTKEKMNSDLCTTQDPHNISGLESWCLLFRTFQKTSSGKLQLAMQQVYFKLSKTPFETWSVASSKIWKKEPDVWSSTRSRCPQNPWKKSYSNSNSPNWKKHYGNTQWLLLPYSKPHNNSLKHNESPTETRLENPIAWLSDRLLLALQLCSLQRRPALRAQTQKLLTI